MKRLRILLILPMTLLELLAIIINCMIIPFSLKKSKKWLDWCVSHFPERDWYFGE